MRKFVISILNRIRRPKAEPSAAVSGHPKAILVRRNPEDVTVIGSPKKVARIHAGNPDNQIIEYGKTNSQH